MTGDWQQRRRAQADGIQTSAGGRRARRISSRVLARLTLIGALTALPALTANAAYCLDYGRVVLDGRLVRQTYAGPPDYESVTKGDEPIVIWVLQLDPSVCVVDSAGRHPKEYSAREIQIELPADRYARYGHLLGAKITVTGTLIRGGAMHDKRLVIAATELIKK